VRLGSAFVREPLIPLLLKKSNRSTDDYDVFDDGRIVGGTYKEMLIGELKWRWFLNTSPYPAPIPRNGVCDSLEEVKAGVQGTL
jgi:hypothetical protein